MRVRFMYADEPDEWIVEEVSCAETECIADFWPTLEVSYVVEHLPVGQPRELQPGECWAYLRYEPSADDALVVRRRRRCGLVRRRRSRPPQGRGA